MASANEPELVSGFAKFPDYESRERFTHATLDPDPHLKSRAYVSQRRPTIVFENLTVEEREQIISALSGAGRWVDDVQFRTMG